MVIDGNRRAMLLRRLTPNQYFEGVILPDAYYENEKEKEIVRLETEYQIGEDSKLDYPVPSCRGKRNGDSSMKRRQCWSIRAISFATAPREGAL
jgi:hypothetical protein